MKNAFTIDVEEYFHAANLEPVAGPKLWRSLESRVVASTEALLDFLSRHHSTATFFTLGMIAERHPNLVKKIAEAGHEIASHGHAHQFAYAQTQRQYLRDVVRSKHHLEDLTGQRVYGYRAPNFSIQDRNAWAYDCLIQAGYTYDSSVFPVRHHRYSNSHRARTPHFLSRPQGELAIVPLATLPLSIFGRSLNVPIAGGAYWRLFPIRFFRRALEQVNQREHLGAMCYLHPWEIDLFQPYYNSLPMLQRLRHYGGSKSLMQKLEFLFSSLQFAAFRDCIESFFPNEASKIFPR